MAIAKKVISMKKYPKLRVCRAFNVSRSNMYKAKRKQPTPSQRDEVLLREIKIEISNKGTYGYRRVTGKLKNRSIKVNHKRVYRIMKKHDLLLSKFGSYLRKQHHTGKVITLHSDTRYASDITEIKCFNGEKVYFGFSIDCCDRELLAHVSSDSHLTRHSIIRLMDETIFHRFGNVDHLPKSIQWLSDNGGQYTASETISYGRSWGFDVKTTPRYSPESNGLAESFVKTFKRDYVYQNDLPDAKSVMKMIPIWLEDYNETAPHSGLNYKSPRQFRMNMKNN